METNIVIGSHSINHALFKRPGGDLHATDEGWKEFKKLYKDHSQLRPRLYKKHDFQEECKKQFKNHGFDFSRVPSGIIYIAPELRIHSMADLNKLCEENECLNLLALDGVTDIHNAAAIIRTSAFYNINGLIISGKNRFGMSPSFFRIASGAAEHIPVFQTSNLSRTVTKLNEFDVETIALSEHSNAHVNDIREMSRRCFILGQEDVGISNAVMRVASKQISLPSRGEIQSLNVSIAAAVTLERFNKN